jgi:pyrimidine deaminase RibD-like protein
MLSRLLNRGQEKCESSQVAYKHVCFIVYKHKIITSKTNVFGGATTFHAEERALEDIDDSLKADLYVFRFDDGEIKNSKPCADCTKLIKKSGIRRVYYTYVDEQQGPGIVIAKAQSLKSDYVTRGRVYNKRKRKDNKRKRKNQRQAIFNHDV